MKTDDTITLDFEKQKKEYVLDFIRKKDLITSEDNVIFSQKIFVVNSVLNWCMDMASKKEMTRARWNKFNKIIGQYIAGVVDLKWKDGALEIIEIPHDDKKRTSRKTRKPRK